MKIQDIFSKHLCITVLTILLLNNGCKKAIEVGPSTTMANSGNAFSSDNAAQSVVAGILSEMSAGAFYQAVFSFFS